MSKPLRICLMTDGIPPEGKGGAERVVWELARGLTKRGHDVSIVTTTRDKLPHTAESTVEGIRIFRISSSYHVRWRAWLSLYNPRPVREVTRIMRDLRPDVVNAHNVHYYLSYASLAAARKSGARVYLLAHDVMAFHYEKLTDFVYEGEPVCKKEWVYRISPWKQFLRYRFRYNPFRNVCIRHYLKALDGMAAVSGALSKALAQNGIPGVQVIHTGIDIATMGVTAEEVAAFRTKHNLEGKQPLFFGGRISSTKGADALLAALPAVVAKVPNAVMLIAGMRDSAVERLLQRAAELGIGENIYCTGWLTGTDLEAAYAVSTVVTIPSLCFDSLPFTALEAMRAAKPIVGSCYGGIPELVEDGVTGYLVHPRDTSTLSAKLLELLTDANRTEQFGKAARTKVERGFSFEGQLDNYLAWYRSAHGSATA